MSISRPFYEPKPPRSNPRPLRELCQELRIYELVEAGLFNEDSPGYCTAQLLGPETHGLSVVGKWGEYFAETADVRARMCRNSAGMGIGTLTIGSPFPGHAWVDEVAVKIPPYSHWMFRCQSCERHCRSLFWPPFGNRWACRRCHRLQYPDKRRLHTLPPIHPALARDPLDEIERGIRRLRLIRDRRHYTVARPAHTVHL
jgi:hypothetical protein